MSELESPGEKVVEPCAGVEATGQRVRRIRLVQMALFFFLVAEILAILIRLPGRWEPVLVLEHGSWIVAAQFSHDGERVLTAGREALKVWNAGTGQCLLVIRRQDRMCRARFAHDGARILTWGLGGARLWDSSTGARLAVLEGHAGLVRTAAFSHDGRRVVTASVDHTARVWDAETGDCLAVLRGHSAELRTAVFSPDGKRVLTASSGMVTVESEGGRVSHSEGGHDSSARIWDAETGNCLAVLEGHTVGIRGAIYSPDGTKVLTWTGNPDTRLWNARSGEPLLVLEEAGNVQGAAFSPDGSHIAFAKSGGALWLFDAESGLRLKVLSGLVGGGISVAYSRDGERILSGPDARNEEAAIWDAKSGRCIGKVKVEGEYLEAINFSPDGKLVLTGCSDGTARVWAP